MNSRQGVPSPQIIIPAVEFSGHTCHASSSAGQRPLPESSRVRCSFRVVKPWISCLSGIGLMVLTACGDGRPPDLTSTPQISPTPAPSSSPTTETPGVTPTVSTEEVSPTEDPSTSPPDSLPPDTESPGVESPTVGPESPTVDPESPTPAPVDNDGDGYMTAQDCDDTDPSVHPGAVEIPYDGIDQDCASGDLTDQDGDGAAGGADGDDCNDQDAGTAPGAEEVPYDGIDQDCSGQDLTDQDGDGANGGQAGTDCDDLDPTRFPENPEEPYDGIDQDCDGTDLTDLDDDGAPGGPDGTDCDDLNPDRAPSILEIPYDGVDQDCDGQDLVDQDKDGFSSTQVTDGTDCNDLNANTYPGAPEFEDDQDNDCDGQIDENLDTTDDDGDGFSEQQGDCNDEDSSTFPDAQEIPYDEIDQDCDQLDLDDQDGDGFTGGENGADCDDQDAAFYPGATEIPYDSLDQDCSGADLIDVDQDGAAAIVAGGNDCNDQDPLVSPTSSEIPYDQIDQDCSGSDLTDVDQDGAASTAAGGIDCNDVNPAINPSATEVCDNIDNNCDGIVDLDAVDRTTYYSDLDSDTFGDPNSPVARCTQSTGLVTNSLDCDDSRANVHPGQNEVCDGLDNNCSGVVDEGVTTTYYPDTDQDGYGDTSSPVKACSAPSGTITTSGDCDDGRSSVYPGAPESCNLRDDDCDGATDEGVQLLFYGDQDGDSYGNAQSTTLACSQPVGYVTNSLDCKDSDADVYPGATELCNLTDDDCDGTVDEDVTRVFYQDNDADNFGNTQVTQTACVASPGYVTNSGDCNDANSAVNPVALETCNGTDDNCNGQLDDGIGGTWYADVDQDGYGNPAVSVQACSAPSGYTSTTGDCNDTSSSVKPGATELCNGIDDNCSGTIDETFIGVADLPDDAFLDSNCDGVDGDAALAIFVAPSGSNLNPGTRNQPMATLNAALLQATLVGKSQLYISEGLFLERILLVNGVSLYGGYSQGNNWRRSSSYISSIRNDTATNGRMTAVEGSNLTSPTTLDRLEIRTLSASGYEESNYAMICSGCTAVTLKNSTLESGAGGPGRPGTNGATGGSGTIGTNGGAGSCDDNRDGGGGGPGGTSSCGMVGGAGGKGGNYGKNSGAPGGTGMVGIPGGAGGSHGSTGNPGSPGSPGTGGGSGGNGAGGSGGNGNSGLWVGGNGANGSQGGNGNAGGGGGGGGGQGCTFCDDGPGNGGGGGGGGACGGTGASGGSAGGGSFGLFLVNSNGFDAQNNRITSGSGGAGGTGGTGGSGGIGAAGGFGATTCTSEVGGGGNGGKGGDGGQGGHGGGGAGGPSFALYRVNSTLTSTGNSLTAGAGGIGGTSPGAAGAAGVSGQQF